MGLDRSALVVVVAVVAIAQEDKARARAQEVCFEPQVAITTGGVRLKPQVAGYAGGDLGAWVAVPQVAIR
jgi:hypothetical protein